MAVAKQQRITYVLDESDKDVETPLIGGSDYTRGRERKEKHARIGFIAENAFSSWLSQHGIEHQHRGGKGETDIIIRGKRFDVKARDSDTGTDLIINEDLTTNDDTDFYVLSIVHRDSTGEPVAVEFVGYISKDEADLQKEPIQMSEDNRCELFCVGNQHLKTVVDIVHFS